MGNVRKKPCFGGIGTLSVISGLLDLIILSSDDSGLHKSPYNGTCQKSYRYSHQYSDSHKVRKTGFLVDIYRLFQHHVLLGMIKNLYVKHMISAFHAGVFDVLKITSKSQGFIVLLTLHINPDRRIGERIV